MRPTLTMLLAACFIGQVLAAPRMRRLAATAEALREREAARAQAEEALRAADRRKDEFLAMLAHELRNPLAPISTGARLLKMLHAENAQIAQTCAIIVRQVEHMTGLVDDLLDVSRVKRGLVALNCIELDLRRVVDDAVEQVRPLANARRQRLSIDLPLTSAWVKGDHKRLVQVAANLLGNAVKYTPEGGAIALTLRADGLAWVLAVRDDGIGMAPELLGRVFDLFAQAAPTPDRAQGGLGIGLALARSLVELHGGSIAAHSAGRGQGSTLTVRLARQVAAAPPAAQDAADRAAAGRSAAALRVLLVDDNADAVHTLQQFLQAAGHRVEVAYCAGDALALAGVLQPHVCLLDIGLPDFDGNELARRLRALPWPHAMMLVAMTGYGRQQDRALALAAGFDHYLVKPLNGAALAEILEAVSAAAAG